ncbi:MAG: protein kinase [Kofleriaceae bacterium]
MPDDRRDDATGRAISGAQAASLVAGARAGTESDLDVAPIDATTRTIETQLIDLEELVIPAGVGDVRAVPVGRSPAPPRRGPAPTPVPHGSAQLVGGRYRIVGRIGEGGMGKVYEATHVQLGKTFALKVILGAQAGDLETRQQFYREARMASSLGHPHIAGVVDFGEDDRVGLYMVMELLDGWPLDKVLHDEGPLPARAALDIALQIADALHYIHERDLVHNDIKTENILLVDEVVGKRRRRQAKLLDFGLARSLSSKGAHVLTGTPHYVAPERIRGQPASAASDVYAMGILLYEILTGKVPWDGPTAEILAGHLDHLPTPPSQLVPDLDPAVERLVLHALAKDPKDRHKDMGAFLYELRAVMDMLGGARGRAGATRLQRGGARPRDRLARLGFDGCRLPLALLDGAGEILAANPAFARFVMGVATSLEGLRVQETPLAAAWSHLAEDLVAAGRGQPVRRLVEVDVADGSPSRRLLLWLDPLEAERLMMGVQPIDPER